jgi:hypothetical protein
MGNPSPVLTNEGLDNDCRFARKQRDACFSIVYMIAVPACSCGITR